ncbi:FAD-dependent monooxygenase [Anatilimnocola sp. NA78]|uniref:FAD-dependent monooxygenase n=1 Tax=Anatilimnocola sp. NA78 TaxID=3415683 RepID=UPI003CE56AB4
MAQTILIVGAGPVGLTAAAALNHHGLKCRIIDKTPAPSDKSKALAVWCRSLELLDDLGLAEKFVSTGLKLTGGGMYANGKRLVHLELTTGESAFGFPLMIPQNETERLLTEHLSEQGIHVERQVELDTFAETPEGVNCVLRHADGQTETIETPWLIGCDGAHSTVRHTLGMEFTGKAEPNDWMLADANIEGPLPKDEVSIYWSEQGVVAFFPINRDRFRMIANTGAAADHVAPADPTLATAQAMMDARGPGGLTISNPVWLANFRINERKVSEYRKGRVLLAGDAAHIHSPAGGQGMNTGMQDAFNLAWKLAVIQSGAGLAEPLLQSYSMERSSVGDQVLKNAERFTTVATLHSPVTQWLRNHIAPILGSFHFVKDKIRNDWFELSINYRHSPLSAETWPLLTGGLAAGDRLCDAPVASTSNGSPTRLFAAIRGTVPRHTLLLLPGKSDEATVANLLAISQQAESAFPNALSTHVVCMAGRETRMPKTTLPVWFDLEGRVYEKLHVTGNALFLVRPDGYIGFRCQPADGNALLEHLSRYMARKK